jgi:hypothetical protein
MGVVQRAKFLRPVCPVRSGSPDDVIHFLELYGRPFSLVTLQLDIPILHRAARCAMFFQGPGNLFHPRRIMLQPGYDGYTLPLSAFGLQPDTDRHPMVLLWP